MGGHTQGVGGHRRARTIRPVIRGHCKGGRKAYAVAVTGCPNRIGILGVQGDRIGVAHRHRHARAVVVELHIAAQIQRRAGGRRVPIPIRRHCRGVQKDQARIQYRFLSRVIGTGSRQTVVHFLVLR